MAVTMVDVNGRVLHGRRHAQRLQQRSQRGSGVSMEACNPSTSIRVGHASPQPSSNPAPAVPESTR